MALDFRMAPFLIIWETTRSCALACKHCRAEAILRRDPDELSTEEAKRLLDDAAAMGTPIFIFSGGDALNREDLEELIRHGKRRGLRLGAVPAATPQLTFERIRSLKEAGLDQIAFSLDGPDATTHDAFRGVEGAFAKTLEGVSYAHAVGLPLQINTCFAAWNFPLLEDMVKLVKSLNIAFWEVFFLVPMGRGARMKGLSPKQFEIVFERLHHLNEEMPFVIKVTEAPHYRKFVIQKEIVAEALGETAGLKERIQHILARPRGVRGGIGLAPHAINSGKGFIFVDHIGNVYPSGFVPIVVGNVREEPLEDIYRNSPLLLRLRNRYSLKGKCGRCEFAGICGGSRARAYALTGDVFASDPSCDYVPRPRKAVQATPVGAHCTDQGALV